jgi:hypothetical protein
MDTHATGRRSPRALYATLLVAILAPRGGTRAEEPSAAAPVAAPAVAAAPAPYSLPWQLRPAVVGNVLRVDTAIAFYENPVTHDGGQTVATMLLGTYKLTPELAPFVRLGVVGNSPPTGTTGGGGVALVNPAVGATYALKFARDFRLALFLGLTIPVGMGGGDAPDPAKAAAARSGILARSAMDNAMFAVNDFTVFPGVGLAYVAHGLTVQAEVTLLQLTRVRGSAAQPDSSKTNFTTGLHVGYFFLPVLSLGAELRYQRWLSTPRAVAADATGTTRDNLTMAVGPRVHLRVGKSTWIRPGIAYAQGLDYPMTKQDYRIVQVDVPVSF